MNADTTKIWTRSEVRTAIGKILVESLGVDEGGVTDDAALVRDLGAESIDFLDISFKSQQTFGVDLPARLIQDRVLAWRDLSVMARVVQDRYAVAVPAEELRMVAPSTVTAMLEHLHAKHGIARVDGDADALALALARRLLAELDGIGLDLSTLSPDVLAGYLRENLHSVQAVNAVMDRFTVAALTDYVASQLAARARLTDGT
jgi:acyl carrier protein